MYYILIQLKEKLAEDSIKYKNLRIEDDNNKKDVENILEEIINHNKTIDENIIKITNEITLHENAYLKESEAMNKEKESYTEKIKTLETAYKEIKNNYERMKIQYDFEINKISTDLKNSEDKMYL